MSRELLRGARVITMVPHRPDWEHLDVLIDGHRIVALGESLHDPAATIVDFSGRIIMPGLINAHLHTWQTGLRSIAADWTLTQYLTSMHGTIARLYRPEDMRIASLAGALSQINAGVTTIGDWAHNNRTPAHTDAAIDGLLESGIRAVFLHGAPYTALPRHAARELDRLLDGPARTHPLLTIGMAIDGPQLSSATRAIADLQIARDRGIVASMHQSGGIMKPGWKKVRATGLFGPLTNIAHGAGLTDHWVKRLVDAGVSFTSTAENELGQGHGHPITARLLPLGTAPSLGTDTDAILTGDLFTAARITLAIQRGIDHDRQRRATGMPALAPTVTSRQALSWATLEGARALGVADQVGTLEKGMHADLIVIDARAANLWPSHDPIAAALHAGAGDVEAVMIAGRWRKRGHALTNVNLAQIKRDLARSGDRIVDKFRYPGRADALVRRVVGEVARHKVRHELHTPVDDEATPG